MKRFLAAVVTSCWAVIFWTVVIGWGPGTTLRAQESALEQAYGSAVHAYFAGDVASARDLLNEVIHGGWKDPRAYYFRGLAQLRMGMTNEADVDFTMGAEIESADPDRMTLISRSLQRVQGQTRVKLEQHRAKGRLMALQQSKSRDEARFGGKSAEKTGDAKAAVKKPADKPATKPADDAADKPADSDKPADDAKAADPFGDEKAEMKKEPEESAAEKPAEKPEAEEKPAEKADEKAEEKPAEKADEKAEEKPAEKKPAEEKPAEEKPTEKAEEKADDAKDPFAEEKPAEKTA